MMVVSVPTLPCIFKNGPLQLGRGDIMMVVSVPVLPCNFKNGLLQ